jgi:NAD(P)-dependent dehydrogenase (short-subunit alcohol dehydrogenase family)
MFRLDGKTVLVTGSSRGIGAAVADACKQAGARVIGHASRPGAADHDFITEDLAAPGAGARLFDKALNKAGRIDAVVNNAGIYRTSTLGDDADWSDGWSETLQVNLRAPADICRSAIAHFHATGGGRIVNIASRAGHRGDDGDHSAYAASKGALIALTKTFARALSGENILFYCVAPGWVETRMAPEDVAAREKAVADIPLGRVAQPSEIGALVAFLLSDACPSATGSTFDVNGASYVR